MFCVGPLQLPPGWPGVPGGTPKSGFGQKKKKKSRMMSVRDFGADMAFEMHCKHN